MKQADKTKYMGGDKCSCMCCGWHKSPIVKIILALIVIGVIADLAIQFAFGSTAYLYTTLYSFIALILLIVLIGWALSMSCSCKGRHWINGSDEDPMYVLQLRYARGEITRKEYMDIKKDLQ